MCPSIKVILRLRCKYSSLIRLKASLKASSKHLSDAKMLTERRKTLMKAEYARCLFKLSEALQHEPRRVKEADKLREDAEHLLRQLDPQAHSFGVESAYDLQVYIMWR